jgi:hypothetical protein
LRRCTGTERKTQKASKPISSRTAVNMIITSRAIDLIATAPDLDVG